MYILYYISIHWSLFSILHFYLCFEPDVCLCYSVKLTNPTLGIKCFEDLVYFKLSYEFCAKEKNKLTLLLLILDVVCHSGSAEHTLSLS